MKVLVTGAGGFIGRPVVARLLANGHRVVAIDRDPSRLAKATEGLTTVTVDIGDAAAATTVWERHAPDAMIHLAWYADPTDYLVSHENLAALATTTCLVGVAVRAGCRKLVLAGSCVEYAPQGRLLTEQDPTEPRTLYGACKHAAWLVSCSLASSAGAELAWGRIFHLHGPDENPRRLIPWVAGELRAGRPVDLTDGTQVRDHLHVDDAAAGIVSLLAPGASGIYNVCSGEPVTLRTVLETVGRLVGRGELLNFGARPHRPGEIMFLAGDSTRLRGLGWAPRFDLETGLGAALRPGPR
jgi:nucleoside-diphosphate-sugar epimerase